MIHQRNKLLKDLAFRPELMDTLEIWDLQAVDYGKKIIKKRKEFIADLNEIIKEIHSSLTGGQEEMQLFYEPCTEEENLEAEFIRNREKDLKVRTTSTGPHRDDLCVSVNGIDIRKYGSQGQQRTAALSLKLSEIFLVEKKIKDSPVLLLDDVLSELDRNRQNYLLDSIHNIQTLVTCTGLDDFISHQFEMNKVFHVVKGTIESNGKVLQ